MHLFQSAIRREPIRIGMNRNWLLRRGAVAVLLIVGAWMLVRGVLPVLVHWPYNYTEPVRAQVVDSRFETTAGWPGHVRSQPIFSYRYLHEGLLFQGSGYRPSGRQAEAVQRYVPGLVIDVFVDPDHPTRAMVRPKMTGGELAVPALGLMLLVLGSALLRRMLHGPEERCGS